MALANTFNRLHLTPVPEEAADARAAAGAGFWRRLLDAMMEARQRQAEREIAYHLKNTDVLTDDLERRMTEQLKGRPLL